MNKKCFRIGLRLFSMNVESFTFLFNEIQDGIEIQHDQKREDILSSLFEAG